jgi:hypothetical protein
MLALGSFICCFSDRKNWEVEGLLYPFHLSAWAEEIAISTIHFIQNDSRISNSLIWVWRFQDFHDKENVAEEVLGGTQFGDGKLTLAKSRIQRLWYLLSIHQTHVKVRLMNCPGSRTDFKVVRLGSRSGREIRWRCKLLYSGIYRF